MRFADRWRVGRIFFAGDAAHVMPPWIGQGMAAGVRDAGNLSWKLAGVLRGELPAAALDSYESERQPHVREVTKQAVFFGRVITERRRPLAALRNSAFRLAMRLPYVGTYFRTGAYMPVAHYPSGFLASDAGPAVGHWVPQPWVLDSGGERLRLDDAIGQRWRVLHVDNPSPRYRWATAQVDAVQLLPSGSSPRAGALVDLNDVLVDWMRKKKATALLLRPDGFVYAGAGPQDVLAPPPLIRPDPSDVSPSTAPNPTAPVEALA